MRMTEESYESMNKLIASCFDANSVIDNLAYNLDYFYFNEIADVVHHKVAHAMPELADLISDKMLELSARPVRLAIGEYKEEYSDPEKVFERLYSTVKGLLEQTRSLISSSDMSGDDEVRIFAESFLERLSKYVKQCEEWINAVKVIGPNKLNYHMKDYTHFILL